VESGRSLVTFKGPVHPSTMKLREELETPVGDGPLLLRILDELGYHVWFRYEKYREEFSLGNVIVAIDETPVGTFVEIEGCQGGIAAAAESLGRGPADYLLDSYRALFARYCAEHGRAGTDMLFAAD
jgi:adenylate cyclase class 2